MFFGGEWLPCSKRKGCVFSRYPRFFRDQIKLGVFFFVSWGRLLDVLLRFVSPIHAPKSFWQKKSSSQRWVGPRVLWNDVVFPRIFWHLPWSPKERLKEPISEGTFDGDEAPLQAWDSGMCWWCWCRRSGTLPSRKLTYPTWGIGKSSSNMPYQGDMLIPWRINDPFFVGQKYSFKGCS